MTGYRNLKSSRCIVFVPRSCVLLWPAWELIYIPGISLCRARARELAHFISVSHGRLFCYCLCRYCRLPAAGGSRHFLVSLFRVGMVCSLVGRGSFICVVRLPWGDRMQQQPACII